MNPRVMSTLCGVVVIAGAMASLVNAQAEASDLPVAPPPRSKSALPAGRGDDKQAKLLATARALVGNDAKNGRAARLEAAWAALGTVLSSSDNPDDTAEALRLAAEVIPQLRIDVVKPWLVSFMATHPGRGLALVEAIGDPTAYAAPSLANNPARRAKLLKIQSAAINACLEKAAEPPAAASQKLLVHYATVWMGEADAVRRATPSLPPAPQPGRPVQPRPTPPPIRSDNSVSIYDLIEAAPGSRFIASLEAADVRARLLEDLTRAFLVGGEEVGAFSYIEQLAAMRHPSAPDLLAEFVRAWTRNRNPNLVNLAGPAPGAYGPNGQPVMRGQPITPATRSLQERNIDELAQLVARIRKLPIAQPDESLLIQAFMSCYTANAIYSRPALQAVFGPPHDLKPESLNRLADQMRANVNALRVQLAQQKSVRKPEDLQAELLTGYAMTRSLLDDSLVKQPANWGLALSRAVVMFDELDFQHDIQPRPDYTSRRAEIMAEFARAAGLYSAQVETQPDAAPNLAVYEQWFTAALGASDLQSLTDAKLPDPRQPAKIRAAMLALPGEAGERHIAEFAAALYPRIWAVKPAMKPRYLRMGAEVVDNHPLLGPAKKLLNYYKDLSKEMKLDVALDGSPAVGSMEPFGVFVLLRHTKELEQGSGGFGRFLQNQVGNPMAYNYGRPAANYRDRFENAANAALGEHFEIASCTFETDKVVSRPTPEEGWRITPYAYLVLKARGPQIDRLPPLQLDLDFMDTAGFVVLGIESPAVPIDASRRDRRPAERVEVVQTVDERKASEGVLRLEVKAAARGLVPDLNQLLTAIPEGFETIKTDTHSLSVLKFDPDSPKPAIRSERTWLVTLRAKPDQSEAVFRFPTAATPDTETKFQRYRDADVVPAGEEIVIGSLGDSPTRYRPWAGIVGAVALLLVGVAVTRRLWPRATDAARSNELAVPIRLTPVTVLGYLRGVETHHHLVGHQLAELQQAIERIERHYFSGEAAAEEPPPELKSVVERWAAIRQ